MEINRRKLKVNKSFERKLKQGAFLGLSLVMMTSFTGKAYADNSKVTEPVKIVATQNLEQIYLKEKQIEVLEGVNIYINGKSFMPTDANGKEVFPFICNGTTYLPVRALANIFGAEVDWKNNTVYLNTKDSKGLNENFKGRPDTKITTLTKKSLIGARILVNDELFIPHDANGKPVEVYIINGTTYLPVRPLAELFNVDILWEGGTLNRVHLNEKQKIDNPKAQEPEMIEAKKSIDTIGKYAELFQPYVEKARTQDEKIGETVSRLANKLMDLSRKYGDDELCNSAVQEFGEYLDMLSEIVGKRNVLSYIYDSKYTYQEAVRYYEYILNHPYETYPKVQLNLLNTAAKNYEKTYQNVNQCLDDLSDIKIKEYENRGFELLKQMEEKVKQKTKTLSLISN